MKKLALLFALVACLAAPVPSFGQGRGRQFPPPVPMWLPMTITNNRADGGQVFFRVDGRPVVLNDGQWWTGPCGTVSFWNEVQPVNTFNLPPFANASFYYDGNHVLCLNW